MKTLLIFSNVEWWMWPIGLVLVAIMYWYLLSIKKKRKRQKEDSKWRTLLKTVIFLLFSTGAFAQDDCETFMATGFSYVIPTTVSAEGAYFTELGLLTRVGLAHTPVKYHTIIKGDNEYRIRGNQFNIYSLIGWRVFRSDYNVSAFLSTGYTIGDVDHARWLSTLMILIPVKSNAIALEPMYIHKQGWTGRLTWYFKF